MCQSGSAASLKHVDDAALRGYTWTGSATVSACGGSTGQCPPSLTNAPLAAGRLADPVQNPDITLNVMKNGQSELTLILSYPEQPKGVAHTYMHKFPGYSREPSNTKYESNTPRQELDFLTSAKEKLEGIELDPIPSDTRSSYWIFYYHFRF